MYAFASEQGHSNIKTDQVGAAPPPADGGNESFGSLGGWRFYLNAASSEGEKDSIYVLGTSPEEPCPDKEYPAGRISGSLAAGFKV